MALSLYDITVRIRDGNEKAPATVFKRTGFRTIVLDQRPVTDAEIALGIGPGSRCNFEIDGHEIFCKGGNMVPPDAFWTRVTQDSIKYMFISVIDSVRSLFLTSNALRMEFEPKHVAHMGRWFIVA